MNECKFKLLQVFAIAEHFGLILMNFSCATATKAVGAHTHSTGGLHYGWKLYHREKRRTKYTLIAELKVIPVHSGFTSTQTHSSNVAEKMRKINNINNSVRE